MLGKSRLVWLVISDHSGTNRPGGYQGAVENLEGPEQLDSGSLTASVLIVNSVCVFWVLFYSVCVCVWLAVCQLVVSFLRSSQTLPQ